MDFNELLARVEQGRDLSQDEMTTALSDVMQGNYSEEHIERLLVGLHNKGETIDEVAGAAAAMRGQMLPIKSRHKDLLDTCGTGGGGSQTFNISTTAALVIAATGVPVAKHGNKSVTSRSGSADVLAELGVNIEASLRQVERCLDELGICFCFAPLMHPAMKHVAAVRRRLKMRTIFNILGPLANPAGATRQLLGAGLPSLRPLLAASLQRLGVRRALVVSGSDGLGEMTLAGRTDVSVVTANDVKEISFVPEDFGLRSTSLDAISVDGPRQSALLVRSVLHGEKSAARDIVLLNAAAGLMAFDAAATPQEAALLAAAAVDSGAAAHLLERLVALSRAGGE